MRQWAANQTAAGVPTHFLDFDAWSAAPNVPAAGAEGDKHYMCNVKRRENEKPGLNYWREPHHNVRRRICRIVGSSMMRNRSYTHSAVAASSHKVVIDIQRLHTETNATKPHLMLLF